MRPRQGGHGWRGRPRTSLSRSSRPLRISQSTGRLVTCSRFPLQQPHSSGGYLNRNVPPVVLVHPRIISRPLDASRILTSSGGIPHAPTVAQPVARHVRNVLELPAKALMFTLRGTIGGLLGLMGFLLRKTRGKSVTELLDAADDENHELFVKMQLLRMEIMEKEEQMAALRRLVNTYAQQTVPGLRNQIKSKDELLKDVTSVENDGALDLMVNLHNRLAAKDATIDYLRSIKSKSYADMRELENRLKHKDTQLVQARDELVGNQERMDSLLRQIEDKDTMILSLWWGSYSRACNCLRNTI